MDAEKELEKLTLKLYRETCEEEYLRNPTNVDNLTKWGAVLMELSGFGSEDDALNMLGEAVSRLEEALTIDPAKHEAHWRLGNVYSVNAFLIRDPDEAKILFDEALRCYQKAVYQSPETEHYLKSLASNAELRRKHKVYTQGEPRQAQQTLGGGPAESFRATGYAKNKSSDLKYNICGWVILAVGIVTWIGMAQSRMPPPPAR